MAPEPKRDQSWLINFKHLSLAKIQKIEIIVSAD